MNALPTSGVWQSCKRMPVESYYVVQGVDKCCGFCCKLTLKWRLVIEENGRLRRHFSSRYVTPV